MLGLRIGILLGFLAGAIVKTLDRPGSPASGAIGQVRAHVREAKRAGQAAAREKADEMQRDFERSVHRDS
jgi:hypothetical protein